MKKGRRQLVYLFSEAGDLSPQQIGGKAASLVTMTQQGLSVPPGFVITTGASRAYLEHGQMPGRIEWQIKRCLRALERQTGKEFGSAENPLLVSVRSGAPVSMPGMMDTILNLGLRKAGSEKYLRKLRLIKGKDRAEDFTDQLWIRFQANFKKVVGCNPPKEALEQLYLALGGICQSWQNPRAREYRRINGIAENLGTAVTVQAMVFGNGSDSGTGVVFSRNVATGDPEIYGEFLPFAQGDEVVGGEKTPLPIRELCPAIFEQLKEACRTLEAHYNDVVEIEFTVERGKLWFLQARAAKGGPVAAARFAVQAVWEKRLGKAEALTYLSEQEVEALQRPTFNKEILQAAAGNGKLFCKGIPAASGAAVGEAVYSSERAQELLKQRKRPLILLRPDTDPDDLPGMLASAALVTAIGGTTCHAAVVARGLGIPAVVGCSGLFFGDNHARVNGRAITEGEILSVDGREGLILLGSIPHENIQIHKEVSIFLKWWEQAIGLKRKPRVVLEKRNQRFSVNRMLNDFYIAEAMVSAAVGLSLELETEARKIRNQIHQEVAEILAAYLIIACAGELGHCYSCSRVQPEKINELELSFNLMPRTTDNRDFVQNWVVEAILRYPEAEDRVQRAQQFLSLAIQAFADNSWHEKYGGKSWKLIAETCLAFFTGKLEHSIFVDRVFDLRHNGNCLFDKHCMLSQHTKEDFLIKQLDCKKVSADLDDLVGALKRIYFSSVRLFCNCPSCVMENKKYDSLYSPSVDVISLYKKMRKEEIWSI